MYVIMVSFWMSSILKLSLLTNPVQLCPENEFYSECGNNNCQNTCAKPNVAKQCKPICTPGCICNDGYLRNSKEKCVPAIECDTCDKNEIFDLCGNTGCVNTCDEPDLQTKCIPSECRAGCICRPGFLRNSQNKCVNPKKCDYCGEDPNAIFSLCGDPCPITCVNKDNPPNCNAICLRESGCACKPMFVRAPNGTCIPPELCPKCTSPNEHFCCGSACDTTCATLGEECPIVNIKCTEMCFCKEGYARDSNNLCIPIKDCPPKKCTDPNAYSAPCGDPCPLTCKNKDCRDPKPCPAICIVNGCKCKKGYVLNAFNKCIPSSKCPSACAKNEEYSMCKNTPCQNTCSNPDIEANCAAECNPGCICRPGFLKNTKGVCVPANECDTCKENEIFDLYGNTECQNTCSDPHISETCNSFRPNPGCICRDGYLRNDFGECIKREKCLGSCKGDPNAYFDPCGDSCPITCANVGKGAQVCTPTCIIGGGCKCKRKYVVDYKGKCVHPSQCPNCTGQNEFYNCGSACDTTCINLGEPCLLINKKCQEMCYCLEGYARDEEGVCIPIEDCPPKVCRDPNEIVAPCGDPCPTTCENKDDPEPRKCPDVCLINGCKCRPGYVRAPNRKCIHASACRKIHKNAGHRERLMVNRFNT